MKNPHCTLLDIKLWQIIDERGHYHGYVIRADWNFLQTENQASMYTVQYITYYQADIGSRVNKMEAKWHGRVITPTFLVLNAFHKFDLTDQCLMWGSRYIGNNQLLTLQIHRVSTHLASSRHPVSWGATRKMASEKLEEKHGETEHFLSLHFSPIFLLAIFCTASQLTKHLDEGTAQQVLHKL